MEKDLVEGFDKEEESKEEEVRRYGIKQKQKKKIRINLLINIILGIILILVVIWIFYLKNQIAQQEYKIEILSRQKVDMINALNKGKDEIDRLSLQSHEVQNKAFTLLEKCFNDTSSLRNQIIDLKNEARQIENDKPIKEIIPNPIVRPRPSDEFCNIF